MELANFLCSVTKTSHWYHEFHHILFFSIFRRNSQGQNQITVAWAQQAMLFARAQPATLQREWILICQDRNASKHYCILPHVLLSYSSLKFCLDIVLHKYSNAAWWRICSNFLRKWEIYIIEFAVFIPTNLTRFWSLGGSLTCSAVHQRSVLTPLPCVYVNWLTFPGRSCRCSVFKINKSESICVWTKNS